MGEISWSVENDWSGVEGWWSGVTGCKGSLRYERGIGQGREKFIRAKREAYGRLMQNRSDVNREKCS